MKQWRNEHLLVEAVMPMNSADTHKQCIRSTLIPFHLFCNLWFLRTAFIEVHVTYIPTNLHFYFQYKMPWSSQKQDSCYGVNKCLLVDWVQSAHQVRLHKLLHHFLSLGTNLPKKYSASCLVVAMSDVFSLRYCRWWSFDDFDDSSISIVEPYD